MPIDVTAVLAQIDAVLQEAERGGGSSISRASNDDWDDQTVAVAVTLISCNSSPCRVVTAA